MSFIRKATRSVGARPSCPIFELWRPENRTVGSRTCRDYCECRCCDYRISTLSNDAQSNAAFCPCLSIKILSKPGIVCAPLDFYSGRRSCEALDFAMHMVAEPNTEPPAPLDCQLILDLEAAIARTQKNCFPCIFYLRSVQDDHVINHTQIASAYVINKHASARFDRGLDDSS